MQLAIAATRQPRNSYICMCTMGDWKLYARQIGHADFMERCVASRVQYTICHLLLRVYRKCTRFPVKILAHEMWVDNAFDAPAVEWHTHSTCISNSTLSDRVRPRTRTDASRIPRATSRWKIGASIQTLSSSSSSSTVRTAEKACTATAYKASISIISNRASLLVKMWWMSVFCARILSTYTWAFSSTQHMLYSRVWTCPHAHGRTLRPMASEWSVPGEIN